jgi:hypothetical protein
MTVSATVSPAEKYLPLSPTLPCIRFRHPPAETVQPMTTKARMLPRFSSPLVALLVPFVLIPPPPPAQWHWPTEGPQHIVRDFAAPLTPWGAGHRGLDLAATGTTVFAPTSGVVTYSGMVVDRGVLSITTPSGDIISMEPVTPSVDLGSRVTKGQPVGVLNEGHCVTLCLHLGLRINGRYRSPRWELGVLQRAVLLPWDYYARG